MQAGCGSVTPAYVLLWLKHTPQSRCSETESTPAAASPLTHATAKVLYGGHDYERDTHLHIYVRSVGSVYSGKMIHNPRADTIAAFWGDDRAPITTCTQPRDPIMSERLFCACSKEKAAKQGIRKLSMYMCVRYFETGNFLLATTAAVLLAPRSVRNGTGDHLPDDHEPWTH